MKALVWISVVFAVSGAVAGPVAPSAKNHFPVETHIAANTENNPVGECMMEYSQKLAPSEMTAAALAEYIADKCMERAPLSNCPSVPSSALSTENMQENMRATMCQENYDNAFRAQRNLTRDFAYRLLVIYRSNPPSSEAAKPRPHH